MKFEWDERKNRINIRKRGFDFADAECVFDGPMLIRLDTRRDYGEDCWVGIGLTRSRVVVVVYTERDNGETIRIISMRKAVKYERKRFKETIWN
ncbi:MAG TPA: BrnT family toxin [Thermoflexia bacterium]|nr:BrnT family toxin [Thermoflexia bacterium]